MTPKVHKLGTIPEGNSRDLLLVLDVSPACACKTPGRKASKPAGTAPLT